MSEREPHLNEGERTHAIVQPEVLAIYTDFGPEVVLEMFGLKGVEGARVEVKGKTVSIVCPVKVHDKYLYDLPPMDMSPAIRLYGSEENLVEQAYRPLGFRGDIRFSKNPDGTVSAQTGLADIVRTSSRGQKAALATAIAVFGLAVASTVTETTAEQAVKEFAGDTIDKVLGN